MRKRGRPLLPKNKRKQTFNLRIDPIIHARLHEYIKKTGYKIVDVTEDALIDYLNKNIE